MLKSNWTDFRDVSCELVGLEPVSGLWCHLVAKTDFQGTVYLFRDFFIDGRCSFIWEVRLGV